MSMRRVRVDRTIAILLLVAAIAVTPPVLSRASPDGHIGSGPLRLALWTTAILLALTGVLVMIRPPRLTRRGAVVVFAQGALVAVLVEAAARRIVPSHPVEMRSLQVSETLGWVTRPNFDSTYYNPGFPPSRFSTDSHGFRRFAPLTDHGFRILVIGDSYTQAVSTSTGKAYYDRLASALPNVDVFAIGVVGYGTVQEYLLLRRYYDSIRPNLVLWQVSSNDFINNDRELEAGSHWNNPWVRKPYWENGRFIYRIPTTSILVEHSAIARAIAMAVWNRHRRDPALSVESSITANDRRIDRSHAVLHDMLSLVRRQYSGLRVVGFLATHDAYVADASARVSNAFTDLGFGFIPGVPDSLERGRREGQRVDGAPHDTHWSPEGHDIVGRVLARSLRRDGWVPGPDTR